MATIIIKAGMPQQTVKEFLKYIHDFEPTNLPEGRTTINFEVLIGQKDVDKSEIMEMFGAVESLKSSLPS